MAKGELEIIPAHYNFYTNEVEILPYEDCKQNLSVDTVLS